MKIKLKKLKLNNIISLIYQNLDFNQIESSKYCKIIKNSNSNSIYYKF
jgi:beta-glucanase (GH16 family)